MAHTPGPWAILRSRQGYPYAITAPEAPDGPGKITDITRWAAISFPSSREAEANARLMAAAPDLLDALTEARLQIRYLHEKFQETGSGNAVLARIDAALARAGQ